MVQGHQADEAATKVNARRRPSAPSWDTGCRRREQEDDPVSHRCPDGGPDADGNVGDERQLTNAVLRAKSQRHRIPSAGRSPTIEWRSMDRAPLPSPSEWQVFACLCRSGPSPATLCELPTCRNANPSSRRQKSSSPRTSLATRSASSARPRAAFAESDADSRLSSQRRTTKDQKLYSRQYFTRRVLSAGLRLSSRRHGTTTSFRNRPTPAPAGPDLF
jgi:hypothetical protein